MRESRIRLAQKVNEEVENEVKTSTHAKSDYVEMSKRI